VSEVRRRTAARKTAADPEREPRRPWKWDRSYAWWTPAGDWSGVQRLVVLKRGKDSWRAYLNGTIVTLADTADQAKVALEARIDFLSDYAVLEYRHERSRLEPPGPYILADDREPFQLTMREAVLLKRAAWDGPEPDDEERGVLDAALERVEVEHERRRAAHGEMTPVERRLRKVMR
jgi:hypothetical protein